MYQFGAPATSFTHKKMKSVRFHYSLVKTGKSVGLMDEENEMNVNTNLGYPLRFRQNARPAAATHARTMKARRSDVV
jgi:hypothetical protein